MAMDNLPGSYKQLLQGMPGTPDDARFCKIHENPQQKKPCCAEDHSQRRLGASSC